jgi:hypothetical protein
MQPIQTDQNTVTLATVGDILLHGRYHHTAADGTAAPLFAGLKALLADCDLAVGNMETVLIRGGTPRPDKLCLEGDPAWA